MAQLVGDALDHAFSTLPNSYKATSHCQNNSVLIHNFQVGRFRHDALQQFIVHDRSGYLHISLYSNFNFPVTWLIRLTGPTGLDKVNQ